MAFEIVKPEFILAENGTQDHTKGNGLSEANTFGKWSAALQVHSFYFVRYGPYDDPKIKAKLDAAEKDVRNKIDARYQIIEKILALRTKHSEISGQITPLSEENQRFNEMYLEGKKKEMAPLNEVLSQLCQYNSRERGVAICSSEAELNKHIKILHNRIQHESILLTEKKQILREIKQLEGTRPKVIAIAQREVEIEESLGSKEIIKDQYILICDDFGGVKKEKKVITAKLMQLLDEKNAIDKDIEKLEVELKAAEEKLDKAREVVLELRKKCEDGNACFYVNRMLLNKAKNLAYSMDITALTDISNSELESFMKTWNESKPFRDDYEKRILVSLDNRQLSRDGRMRNPNVEP